jgi:O-succinylbenzoic acid--CoA ligase
MGGTLHIRRGEARPAGGPLGAKVESARGRWTERRGLLLRLWDEGGEAGQGEASPLAGFSRDTMAQCEAALAALCAGLAARPLMIDVGKAAPVEVRRQLEAALGRVDPALPAARFAVASALLDLWGRRAGVPAHRLLRGADAAGPVPLSALIDGEDEAALIASAHAALRRGLRALKWKLGRRPFADELRMLGALRAAIGPEVALRLDAGQSFPPDEVADRLAALAPFQPEYVEEPAPPAAWPPRPAVPLALDESLLDPSLDVEALLRARSCAALVLKPMALDPLRCLDLAALARAHGTQVVITHLFDGPVGLAAAAELALAVGAAPSGLDAHAGLRAFPPALPLRVRADHITPEGPPGLGLTAPPAVRLPTLSLFDAAAEAPEAPALLHGGEVLTYAALADRAAAVLGGLRGQGLLPADGRPVAVVGTAEPRTIVLLLALFAAGVPVALLHPRLTAKERAALAVDCAAAWVADESFAPPTDASGHALGSVWPRVPDDERPLVIIYTSGTTGRPKGAVLSRAAFVAAAAASAANLDWLPDDRWLLCLPLSHIGGLSILTRCLLARKTVVLGAPGDAQALAGLLAGQRVTLASLVPTQLARLLAISDGGRPWSPPPHLRAVLLGGAPASPALVHEAARRGVPVRTTYGLTEACSQVTTQTGDDRGLAPGAGPPLPGVEVRIVGAGEAGEAGEGEIQIRGPSLFSGYLGAPSPFLPGGWFPTGDIGRLDERGRLHVLSRRSDLIVTGGENVYPAEVEQALEALPGVRAACVFGVPDELWGQKVAAALVLDREEGADVATVAAGLAEQLAPHKRPRLYARVPALLYLPGGAKLDRRATAAAAAPHLMALRAGAKEC